jgi:hypothetical protein
MMSERPDNSAPSDKCDGEPVRSRRNGTETAANIAIIVVASIATIIMIRSNVFDGNLRQTRREPARQANAAGRGPAVGTKIDLPGVNWAKNKQTLVLALSKSCRFCAESAPFYKQLASETAGRPDLKLVAVFPHESTDEANAYLKQIEVPITEVRQAPLETIGVTGTPTLALVDGTGTVTATWVGLLGDDRQSDLLARFKCDECQ